jgi:prepilin-type N-terminal cleavage/methylation domain-containing protein
MNIRNPKSSSQAGSFKPGGFTLVELLMVILVIGLLAVMLIPTVMKMIEQGYLARSATKIKAYHEGVVLYKDKTSFYPGQKTRDTIGVTSNDPVAAMKNQSLTGSQVLASAMFGIPLNKVTSTSVNPDNIIAGNTYVTYKDDSLIDYEIITRSGTTLKRNSVADGFPGSDAMPILYYLARDRKWLETEKAPELRTAEAAARQPVCQFQYLDNKAYTQEHSCDAVNDTLAQRDLENWINNRGPSSGQVLNAGSFILIAPGRDRDYLVDELPPLQDNQKPTHEPDKDDITNDYGRRIK